MITVFTPTFNRAALLPELCRSLRSQCCKDFEWLIVDDGSTDGTEAVVTACQKAENGFPIRYVRQEHGGKHRAINLGVTIALGEYFFIVDSDDLLTEDAIEKVSGWLKEIKEVPGLCGVAGQRISPDGDALGQSFSGEKWVDATNLERRKFHIDGDKAEVFSTETLREHPFPEFEGEYFVTEDTCWDAIAADGYRIRWYNTPIYICEYREGGLTQSGANDLKGHVENFQGYSFFIRQCLRLKPRTDSYRDFVEFNKTCDAMGLSIRDRADALYWSEKQFRLYQLLVMPFLHNVKRVQFVWRKITGKSYG